MVTMLLALYEYPALVSYEGFNNVRYTTMLSENGVKTQRCLYDEIYEPLRLTMLSGNGAQISCFDDYQKSPHPGHTV